MSKQRYLDTKFWDDSYIMNKDPIEKLLFIYLLTNPLTNICGIYEINIRRIAFDTGIEQDMVLKIIERFEKDNKIKYENGWLAIKNFIKYQKDNPSIRAGISYELQTKPKNLLDFIDIQDYKPTEKKYKGQKVHKALREKILKKYDYKCCFCGSKENLEIDHIIPIREGGTKDEDNLRILCKSCNGKRNAGMYWDKIKNGWTMGDPSEKMGDPSSDPYPSKTLFLKDEKGGQSVGRPSYLNLNTNTNISSSSVETVDNSKISSDIRDCPVEIPVNNLNKKKKPANNIEFDFELWSWHGIDDDIMDRWVKIFPGVEVNLELMKMREFFKTHPGHEKIIKQKFNNNYAIYIFNWLERAMRYKNDNSDYKEGEE